MIEGEKIKTWNVYRRNGEWVFAVLAANAEDALTLAWRRYFGCLTAIAHRDGTLVVVPKEG